MVDNAALINNKVDRFARNFIEAMSVAFTFAIAITLNNPVARA